MTDLTIIRRSGRYAVLAESQPVRLRDGTVVDLHLVQEDSHPEPCRFLRAVLDHPLIQGHVFDVRDLASCLDAEIRQLPSRDTGDVVVLTLRQFFPDGAGMLCRIVEESLAKVLQAQEQYSDDAAISQADADLIVNHVRRQGQTLRQRRHRTEASHAAA